MTIFIASIIVAGIAIAIGSLLTAFSQGWALSKAMEGIARQPEASGSITGTLIIGLAFIESLAIYFLAISIIIIFANPFTAPYQKIESVRSEVEVLKLEIEKSKLEVEKKNLIEKLKTEGLETKKK